MININNLSISYKGREVIHGISENIDEGLTVIIGLNGCGKSTLMKAMAGIHEEYRGRILYDNNDIKTMANNSRACLISYMPQVRQMPAVTVAQYVIHGRYPYISGTHRYSKDDYEIAYKLLDKLNIYRLRNKKLVSLSGGERQKAYLAMALVQDTKYILLDEPNTFLDIHYQFELMRILKELAGEGKRIVMIQHDIQMALKYADKIIVLKDGSRIFSGSVEEVASSGIIETMFGVKLKKIKSGGLSFYAVVDGKS